MKKLIITLFTTLFALSGTLIAADYSASTSIDVRVGGYIAGGGTAFDLEQTTQVTNTETGEISTTNVHNEEPAIGSNAAEIDTAKIAFDASVDNVSASVAFANDDVGDAGTAIRFDSFTLTVSDLAGFITLEFYDWGYSAGSSANEGNYILADVSFHGVYADFKLSDSMNLGLGFGINTDSYRGLRLDYRISAPVPISLYAGLIIHSIDNASEQGFGVITFDEATGEAIIGGIVEEGSIERLQLGFEVSAYQDYVNIGFGITPFGTLTQYYQVGDAADEPTRDSPNFTIDVSGSASFANGFFNLGYGVQYSADTITKILASGLGQVLGENEDGEITSIGVLGTDIYPANHRLSSVQGDGSALVETLAFTINPSISLGQISLGMPIKYQYYSGEYGDFQLLDQALHVIDIDPQLSWAPASGFFVNLVFEFELINHTEAPNPDGSADDAVEEAFGTGIFIAPTGNADSERGSGIAFNSFRVELQVGGTFGISSTE